MKRIIMTAIACGLAANLAFAQTSGEAREDLDVTMRIIVDPDVATPDEIVRRIPLPRTTRPDRPADSGKPDAEARGDAPGRDVAAEAREKGVEFGRETAERARELAEEARRNAGPPDGLPGPPVLPALPGDLPVPPVAPPAPTDALPGSPVTPQQPPGGG